MTVDGTSLSMTRGDSEAISVSVSGYNIQEGDFLEMTVRKTVNSSVAIYKRVETFSDNVALISIEPDDTSKLTPGDYVYDVQLTFGGAVKTIVKPSVFSITPEVTYGTHD